MDFRILGPLQALDEGREVPLAGSKQRSLLAVLLLHANETLSTDRLIDELWGEHPPGSAEKALQVHVSRLRKALAESADGSDGTVVTRERGYELKLDPEMLDANKFERLVAEARNALAAGDSSGALSALERALSLWRGPPLADLAYEPFAQREIARLSDLRIDALELLFDAKLAQGRHAEVVGQLETLIEQHPYRERLRAQLMLGLYRCDRQADALQAYQNARRQLVEELGIEPGAELRDLHARILRQDPSLVLPAAPVDGPEDGDAEAAARTPSPVSPVRALLSRRRARRLVAVAAAAALVVIAVVAITRLGGSDHLSGIDEGAVGVIDPKDVAITAQHPVGSSPGAVAAGAGSVWVASPGEGTVSRIRRDAGRVETIDVGPAPSGLAFGAGSLWVAGGDDGGVAQVDPAANRVVQRVPVGNGLRAVAVGYGAVWAATALDGEVVRIDLRSGRVTRRIAVGGQPGALATGAGSVWVAAEESGTIDRIDPGSGEVLAAIPVGNGPIAVAVGLGAVWSANRQDGTVSRIDPATNRVTDTTRAGRKPVALTIADGALWVADADGAVLRLDPDRHAIAERLRTGSAPAGMATFDGRVWATAVATPNAHRGGTLRVGSLPYSLDPAVGGFAPDPVLQLAYEGLVGYRREGGAAGARLVGGLAARVPKPTDGGRRYVFHLRRGLRYSDGTRVRAGDFRASMERAWAVSGEAAMPFPDAIEGVARCRRAPRHCDLSRGIVADQRAGTVTIRLRRPDPDLLQGLTFPLLSVVPPRTPRRALTRHPPPGTGPYRVQRVVPGRRAVLTRNPHFRQRGPDGRPAGFVDRVEAMGGEDRAQLAAVERGRLDVLNLFDPATPAQLTGLRTRLGSRLRSASAAFTEYAWLNVKARPFDDPRVRRALNLAVDRARVVDRTGGPIAGAPTCQVLPPGLPGYRPICPFTAAPSPAGIWTAPAWAEAKRLVAGSGTRGTAVEVWAWAPWRGVGRHLEGVLRDLGFRSRLRVFGDLGALIDAALDARRRPQIGLNGWIADPPEPDAFLKALVSCHGFAPDNRSPNLSQFCDPGIDAAIERARAAGPEAGAAWQRIERRIAERAPVVPLTTRRSVVATSRRVGNLQFHPTLGVLLDYIWVR